MANDNQKPCKHKDPKGVSTWYEDRQVVLKGKRYRVMRCSLCGAEKYEKIK